MSLFFSYVSVFLLCAQLMMITGGADADYQPTNIFLNCGGPPLATDNSSRVWTTDISSKFACPGGINSTTSPAATLDPAVPAIPYMTAHVFHSPFTYTFPVTPGRVFLRLYFYRSSYAGLNISDALFTVTTQSYTLLNNFSAAMEDRCIVKEYMFNMEDSKLSVTFIPTASSASTNYYAFVNGIEVVSFSRTTDNEASPAAPAPIANPQAQSQPQQGTTDHELFDDEDTVLLLLTVVVLLLLLWLHLLSLTQQKGVEN